MGIKTIAVFSEADRASPYVGEADIANFIGDSAPGASYLDQDKIIEVAKRHQADAIHPGYGFLAENPAFAKKCEQAGIIFIGPNATAIGLMGSKSKAKTIMKEHGVPIIPGYQGSDQTPKTLTIEAQKIGFPVLLKAAAGGGGKGMRIVEREELMVEAIGDAKRESLSAFGDDELFIEKYFTSSRHIEFQIFGDQHGNVIHLFERECTIQRRYQKIIEESPSPILNEANRAKMAEAALKAAKALNYDNAGTVEFLFSDKGDFYFLEVNTRLQVEHPVTEEITSLDLVKMQIESAEGRPLSVTQSQVESRGYAIECRLYAEDPDNNYLPVTGKILKWELPSLDGLRVESGVTRGSEVSIFYDPMIAKVVVWEMTREAAHRKMLYALRHLKCLGLTTNQDYLKRILCHPEFSKGAYDTHFLERMPPPESQSDVYHEATLPFLIAVALYRWNQREVSRSTLGNLPSGWRNNFYTNQKEAYILNDEPVSVGYQFIADGRFNFRLGEQELNVELIDQNHDTLQVEIDGVRRSFSLASENGRYFVHSEDLGTKMLLLKDRFPVKELEKIKGGYMASMPSEVIKIMVKEGDKVEPGDRLAILSSMKMENTILANEAGVIESVSVEEGQYVEAGFLLLKLKTD